MGSTRGHVTYFLKFLDPLHISGTVKARNFKFCTQIGHLGVLMKKCKIRSKGVLKGSRDLLLELWDPLHISGTVQARNFKFGMQIGHWAT